MNNELAEKELIKKFRHDNTWLSELKSKNQWVSNDVIKIPKQGTAPAVLINNAIFPIASNNRTDDFVVVSLNKYDTENTRVTQDELYAIAYEKLSDVQTQHREELEDQTAAHALFSIAVPANTVKTPVLETTGPLDGTRKRLTTKDLITMWKKLNDLKVPLAGRVIVLSSEHAADLMFEDSSREKTWGDLSGGLLASNHVGFKLYTAIYSPNYKLISTVWTKQAYGAVVAGQVPASVVFYNKNACKATGTVTRFAREAKDDPENRQNTIGFQLWFVAVGIKEEGFAAIVSGS